MKVFFASTKPTLGGLMISLAVVFGGSASFAEGLMAVGMASLEPARLVGGFSADDLQSLEHASAGEATVARLAAMGVDTGIRASRLAPGRAADGDTPAAGGDVFRYSARILPLLVTRADAVVPVATVGTTPRPGLVQPVGVSAASLQARFDRTAQ